MHRCRLLGESTEYNCLKHSDYSLSLRIICCVGHWVGCGMLSARTVFGGCLIFNYCNYLIIFVIHVMRSMLFSLLLYGMVED